MDQNQPPSDKLELILYRLERLEEKLDTDVRERFKELEGRVQKLEVWQIRTAAIGGVLLFVWPYAYPVIRDLLTGK